MARTIKIEYAPDDWIELEVLDNPLGDYTIACVFLADADKIRKAFSTSETRAIALNLGLSDRGREGAVAERIADHLAERKAGRGA